MDIPAVATIMAVEEINLHLVTMKEQILNMRVIKLLLLLTLMSELTSAQIGKTTTVNTLKATFLGLSYSYEQSISQKSTINYEFMLAGAFGTNFISGN